MNKKQQGFGTVVIVSLIAVVLIVGAVGYYFVMRGSDKKTDEVTKIDDSAKKKSAAASLVESSYTAYLEASKGEGISPSALTAFETNVTSELANNLKTGKFGYDPILCAQNVPVSISYGKPTLEGKTAMIELTTTYENPPVLPITVEVDTASNKISRIVCHIDN